MEWFLRWKIFYICFCQKAFEDEEIDAFSLNFILRKIILPQRFSLDGV
jgi:hypothetical protein